MNISGIKSTPSYTSMGQHQNAHPSQSRKRTIVKIALGIAATALGVWLVDRVMMGGIFLQTKQSVEPVVRELKVKPPTNEEIAEICKSVFVNFNDIRKSHTQTMDQYDRDLSNIKAKSSSDFETMMSIEDNKKNLLTASALSLSKLRNQDEEMNCGYYDEISSYYDSILDEYKVIQWFQIPKQKKGPSQTECESIKTDFEAIRSSYPRPMSVLKNELKKCKNFKVMDLKQYMDLSDKIMTLYSETTDKISKLARRDIDGICKLYEKITLYRKLIQDDFATTEW